MKGRRYPADYTLDEDETEIYVAVDSKGRIIRSAPLPPENPNILEGLPWVAGTNTTLSIAGGKARATSTGGNPRIKKHPTALVPGATYYLNGMMYKGTSTNVRMRFSTDADLGTTGMFYELIESGLDKTFINEPIVIPGGVTDCYAGIVAVVGAVGEYAEIDDLISLTSEPL